MDIEINLDEDGIPFLAKRLNSSVANEHAEMQIIEKCATEATAAFRLYFERKKRGHFLNEDDDLINIALFRDGVIQIMNCFNTKSSKRSEALIPSEVFQGIDNWEVDYKFLHDYRDSFAAHKFGPLRLAHNVGYFRQANFKLRAIVKLIYTDTGMDATSEDALMAFCGIVLAHISERIDNLQKLLENETKLLSSEEVKSLPDHFVKVPGPSEFRSSRLKHNAKPRSQ